MSAFDEIKSLRSTMVTLVITTIVLVAGISATLTISIMELKKNVESMKIDRKDSISNIVLPWQPYLSFGVDWSDLADRPMVNWLGDIVVIERTKKTEWSDEKNDYVDIYEYKPASVSGLKVGIQKDGTLVWTYESEEICNKRYGIGSDFIRVVPK